MRQIITTLSLAAFMALTSPVTDRVHAETVPLPQTDFAADWEFSSGDVGNARIVYSAQLRKMRIEMTSQGEQMTMVRDMSGGSMVMWTPSMPGMAMKVDNPKDMKIEGEPTAASDTVNGEACTIWTSQHGEACVTADGIPVRTSGKGETATLVNLDRSAQDAALFEPPAGTKVMSLPAGIPMRGMPNINLPF